MVPSLAWSATGGTVDGSGKYRAWSTPGKFHVIATAPNGLADTALVTITLTAPVLAQILLSPANVSLSAGASQQYFVEGKTADSLSVGVNPVYTATGGTISPLGAYIAGSTPGTFQVIASDTASGLADTALVTIAPPAPTLQAVVLTPGSATLQAGTAQQFVSSGRLSDGSTSSVSVVYTATGGTITSGGLYTAGSSAGSYRVIATVSGATLADTAAVNIAAPTPAPEPPTTPAGVPVLPGQSIQAAVNANNRGTTFILKAGTHTRQSIVPKTGDTFWCEAGAILDGQNVTQYAFTRSGSDPDSVRIVGCIIEHYVPPAQSGAIQAGWATPSDGTYGWIIDSTEVRDNANAGIRFGNHTKVRWSNVHHNGAIGITGIGDSVLIENTEIAYNNYQLAAGLGFESGGTKFVKTNGLVLRNNFVHHNKGPGLWLELGIAIS